MDLEAVVNHLLNIPETISTYPHPSRAGGAAHGTKESQGASTILVDVLDSAKDYTFYLDVPGLSKSDIQVTVEDDSTLVIRSNGKRKREDGEEEGCKYIRLERKGPQKMMRKFRLPENANVGAIAAKCENGVLTVVVGKHPPSKPKTVAVNIS